MFFKSSAYFRCVVIDWGIWDGSYFGDPFEPEALKKRRAYKKWAEMLLQPELCGPESVSHIVDARLFLDRLLITSGYDVLDHLEERFTRNYRGNAPYIREYQHTDSWRDANQALQLCDLLTGCIFNSLCPSSRGVKIDTVNYLDQQLKERNEGELSGKYWRQFAPNSLGKHHKKFSAWFWQPLTKREKRRRKNKKTRMG